jgi:hypothetical protein
MLEPPIMFDYITKSDTEGRQQVGVQLLGGFAVLGVLIGTWGLLSGLTARGLLNVFLGISAGVMFLHRRKTHR